MKPSITDEELHQAHLVFQRDHLRLRHKLLESLSSRPTKDSRSSFRANRFAVYSAALSVCLAVVVTSWVVIGDWTSRTVYAVDGIHERFQNIQSLHVKGFFYSEIEVDGKKVEKAFPMEWYAERPNRYFHRWVGIESDGKNTQIKTGFSMADAEQQIFVSDADQSATNFRADPLQTEMQVEYFLQSQLMNQIVRGPSKSYRLAGTEQIRGRQALKYEYEFDSENSRTLHSIWLDSETGLPVQSAVYMNEEGKLRLHTKLETIAANVVPPDAVFPFALPDGYRLIQGGPQVADFQVGSAGAGKDRSALRYSFAIDHQSVLICWYHGVAGEVLKNPDDDPVIPKAELKSLLGGQVDNKESRQCELIPLRFQEEAEGEIWRWSLAVPLDRKPIKAEESFVVTFTYPTNKSRSIFESPLLQLPDEKLRTIVQRIKEMGTPCGEGLPELTLARLRWLSARYVSSERIDQSVSEPTK